MTLFELAGATYRYEDIVALDALSVAIESGTRVALLGANGSGKSTLLKIMAGLDKEFNGEAFPLADIKIGYLKADFEGKYPNKTTDSLTLITMKNLGAELIPMELPSLPSNDISFLLSVESAAAFDDLTRSNRDDLMVRQIKNAWPNVFRAARFVPAVEYIQANRHRSLLIQDFHKKLGDIDVYLSPAFQVKT